MRQSVALATVHDAPRFVRAVGDGLRPFLPEELRAFTFTPRYRLAQVAYAIKGFHYEVWLHDATQHLEIGFHMEADMASNASLYDYLEDELLWLKAQLGPCIELERWDRGWCRLYRTLPLGALTPSLLETTCAYLALLVQSVEPLCREWWSGYQPLTATPRRGATGHAPRQPAGTSTTAPSMEATTR
jgi:hypothetical protein